MKFLATALVAVVAIGSLSAPAGARHYTQRVHGPVRLLPHHRVRSCEVKWVAHHRVRKCNYH